MNASGTGKKGVLTLSSLGATEASNLNGDGGMYVCVRVCADDARVCVRECVHACLMCLQYTIIIFHPG